MEKYIIILIIIIIIIVDILGAKERWTWYYTEWLISYQQDWPRWSGIVTIKIYVTLYAILNILLSLIRLERR